VLAIGVGTLSGVLLNDIALSRDKLTSGLLILSIFEVTDLSGLLFFSGETAKLIVLPFDCQLL